MASAAVLSHKKQFSNNPSLSQFSRQLSSPPSSGGTPYWGTQSNHQTPTQYDQTPWPFNNQPIDNLPRIDTHVRPSHVPLPDSAMNPRDREILPSSSTTFSSRAATPLNSGSRTPSPQVNLSHTSQTSATVRRYIALDWPVDILFKNGGGGIAQFQANFQSPSTGVNVSCYATAEGDAVWVSVDPPEHLDVQLKVFNRTDPNAAVLEAYKSSKEQPIFRIPLQSLRFLSPHSSPSILLSLTLTHPSSSSSSPPPAPAIYETTSPAAIETLSHFLDQQGGHDVVFCFPNESGRELYADRYVLQRCSPYFRSLFGAHPDPDRTHAQPLNDRDHGPQNQSPNAGSAGMGSPSSSVRSRGTPDGSERDITTSVLTPLTSVAGDSNAGGSKEADPARIPLPPDNGSGLLQPGKFQNQRAPTPMMGDNVFVMNVNETSYNTFRAFLYYLYTGFISFAPLTSSFHFSTSEMSPTEMERRRLDSRNALVGDYMRKFRNRPVPVSPKSIYAVAKKYELPVLEAQALSRITQAAVDPLVATCELFSAFTRAHEVVREQQLDTVVRNWDEIVRSKDWALARERGMAQPDAYFASVLCEILERLPARAR